MDVALAAVPVVTLQLTLPLVLLWLDPVGRERVGGVLAAVTRAAVIGHTTMVILVELGAASLLAETAHGPMRCGTGFAPLIMLVMVQLVVSAAAALLFALCCAIGSDSSGLSRLAVFLGGLLMGSVLFTTWLAPFLFLGHMGIGQLAALFAVPSAGLTTLLVHRMTTAP